MKKSLTNWTMIAGILLVIAAVVLIIWFFLRGETTVSGNYPDPVTSRSLSCVGNNIPYPFFDDSNTTKTEIQTTSVFSENKLESTSLIYSLYYTDTSSIDGAEGINHAKINLATQSEGLGSDIFYLHFSKLNDRLEARLYAKADEINNKNSKYLMLNGLTEGSVYTENLVKTIYESQGLKCSINTNK